MKLLTTIVAALCLCGSGPAQAGNEAVHGLNKTATEELGKSLAELAKLRSQIESEKLPLAKNLTTLEDRLAELRKEHDRYARQADEDNLAVANLKTESKLREGELAYTATLLDEYTRSLESKVNVSELQYCGKAIDAAKQAAENDTLPRAQRFTTQLALVTASITRAFDAIGGMRFAGEAVDPTGAVASGQFALVGPVAMFRAVNGSTGVVMAQPGSTRPLVRALDGELQTGMASLVQGGQGAMPFDPSLGAALKALVSKTNLIHIFVQGGPIMWPLLAASILALGAVLERLLFLMNEGRKRDSKALERLFNAVQRGALEEAIQIGRESKFFVARALGYALSHREQSLPNALVYAQSVELKRFRRGIPILDTVITLAPLLGLLGTVTGMMGSFALIGGDLNSPGAITGGIAEALIATAFGLGIAITALLPFNWLNTKLDQATHELDQAATHLEVLMQNRRDRADRHAATGHDHAAAAIA